MRRAEIAARLRAAGIEDYNEEAKRLFCHFSGMSPALALAEPGADCSAPALLAAIARREAREPLAYILEEAWFFDERYRVTPACLIPRQDTELLVEYAIEQLPTGALFADFCTGSGCIAISTLAHRPDARAEAYDISQAALALARENAEANGVRDRIFFHETDLLAARAPVFEKARYDMILSNPPYVTPAEWEEVAPELHHEPPVAFLGGEDGLVFYRHFITECASLLTKNGCFVFEIGYRQADGLRLLAEENGFTCEIRQDFGGRDRMAILKRIG
ncbi:MAG: peptide chain release factor N(5)-glutamine methyltransferase [Clostridia bacterium]|nr:peptide chain release factor N(5)-glutamine methyltransferase [Clostridia bacterium]